VCWWSPGPAEHEVVQDVHGVRAVLAGGVGIAADIQAVLGHVIAGQAAGYLLLGFQGPDAFEPVFDAWASGPVQISS